MDYDIKWMQRYKVYVGKSDIHGVGLKAIKDIKKGEQVYYYRNYTPTQKLSKSELISKGIDEKVIETLSRLYFCDEENLYLQPNQQIYFVNFLNHSENPNMVFIRGFYMAKRDIKQDEEVTLDFLANGYHPQLSFKPKKKEQQGNS
tara:strand:+ start:458 stop:895 length:438 start_codon:yes stop_codon:yes gene_type:complete